MPNTQAQSQFQPIFGYIDETKKEILDDVHGKLAGLASKDDIQKLQVSLDPYAKQTKDYYQEVTVVIAKVNRMESWIQKAAPKLGVAYEV